MRQATLYGVGDLRMEERPLDHSNLEPDQLYVETAVTALSTGTDLGNYLGDSTYVPDAPDYPRPVGYSNVGTVKRVGSAVREIKPEQRIFSRYPHQSAFIARESEVLTLLPDGLSAEVATLTYLTHLGLAALRQARYETGENVAVVGLGVIGLGTVGLARAMGAKVVGIANSPIRCEAALKVGADAAFESSDPHLVERLDEVFGNVGADIVVLTMGAKVVGIANSPIRCEAALKVGADAAFESSDPHLVERLDEVFGNVGADIVVLTANPWPAYRLSVDIARQGGRVSILGFPGRFESAPDFNPLDPSWFYGKQLTLLGAGLAPGSDCPPDELRFNLRRNLQYIIDLMAGKQLQLESLITHRLPADRMHEAYELAKAHSKDLIAAVFDWKSA